MTRINWGQAPRPYDAGLDRGVLYSDGLGVPWNGLISVEETDPGELDATHYFEGRLLVVVEDLSDFAATIEAYTYPNEFEDYTGFGLQDPYKRFGLSYRTGNSEGDKLHLVYNALSKPSNRTWKTLTQSSEPTTFSWDISTSAIPIPGARPASHLVVDTSSFPNVIETIGEWLYGTDTSDPRLPTPAELIDLFETETMLKVVYHGDGTWTATGPDSMIQVLGDGSYHIQSPSAFPLDNGAFVVSSA